MTFGILYGSSVGGIAMNLKISKEEAERLIALYFKAYPKIEEYVKSSHEMAKLNKMVVTPFGQRKMEFGTYDCYRKSAVYNAALRNAQNVRVQSTASTLGLMAFSEVNKEIKSVGGRCTCTVYDSLELEVPIERAAEAIEIAFRCMDDWPVEAFDFLDEKIGVDCEIGFSWGTMSHISRGVTQDEINRLLIQA